MGTSAAFIYSFLVTLHIFDGAVYYDSAGLIISIVLLGRWLEARNFAGAFNVQRRAEEVPVDEFVALAVQVGQS